MRINIYLILQIVICLQMAIGAENTIPERKLIRLRGSHNHRSEGTIKQDDNTVVLQPHENEKEQDEHLDEVEEREEEGKEDECEHENESECEFYKRASQSPSHPHHKRQREEEPQHPDLPTPKKESPIHPPSPPSTYQGKYVTHQAPPDGSKGRGCCNKVFVGGDKLRKTQKAPQNARKELQNKPRVKKNITRKVIKTEVKTWRTIKTTTKMIKKQRV